MNTPASSRTPRRLVTPERELIRSRRSRAERSRSPHQSGTRSRSRSRRRDERERILEKERDRLRRLERELQRDRDSAERGRRNSGPGSRERLTSDRRSRNPRSSQQGSTGRQPERSTSRTRGAARHGSRGRSGSRRGQAPNDDIRRGANNVELPSRRSGSPVFCTNDIVKLLSSLRERQLSPRPGVQSLNLKHVDFKNILPDFNPATKNQRMDVWLKKVNECASVYGWDDRTTVHFAMQKLQGLAKTWYESLNTILFTWQEWQEKLMSAFPCEQNYGQSLEDMLRRKSRYNESIEVYYYEKLALLNQCDITGKHAVDCIIHGISDRTMKSSALALRCSMPEMLLQFLISNKDSYSYQQRNKIPTSLDQNNQLKTPVKPGNNSIFCFNCKQKGHPYLQCPKPLIRCDACSRVGHKSDNCSFKRDGSNTKTDHAQKTMRISDAKLNSKFVKTVVANGLEMEAFIDLGSEVTLIKESFLSKLECSHDGKPTVMKGFGNSLVTSLGSVNLNITVDDVTAIVPCRVVRDNLLEKPILIGQTFSEQPHIILYKDADNLKFLNINTEMPYPFGDDGEMEIIRISKVGHSVLYGTGSIKAATSLNFSGSILLETKIIGRPSDRFIVHGGVYKVDNGMAMITVSPYSIPCLIQNNAIFSRGEKINVVSRILDSAQLDTVNVTDIETDINKVTVGDSVSEIDRQNLITILRRFRHCFANSLRDLQGTNITEMHIELNSQRPVVYRPYRLSHHERSQVREMITEMLEAGIIRDSVSNYASPIILVRKKDGKTRMCIDYRMLNSVTVKMRYPMPIIEDEVAQLSGKGCFITLDLTSSYYQVPIAEHCKYLTAFVTPDGQYEFNRVPFGLANAPALFQRMMRILLSSMSYRNATAYIDDLLIFGETPGECLDTLEAVLGLLEQANLKLNMSKCKFLQNQIDYLGYEISSSGMRPGHAKVDCVVNFPRPSSVHGVRQFLGLVSYFRKFIQSFAEIAFPLTRLLKKDASWRWAADEERAFNTLKDKLSSRPVLAIYNPAAETELHTDASRIGVGGILLQRTREGDPFQPVAFYSRQTSPEEKNFHAYELETLAVVCSLRKFRVYLLGIKFKVVTDCSALRSTFSKRDLIPRIARWWLTLQEFDCSIEYRAGSKMTHVDALSRNPVNTTPVNESPATVMSISDDDWLLTLQLGDSELVRIRDILNSDLSPKELTYITENYVIRDNKLFRCLGGNKEDIRWVVPKGARWQLCRLNHDEIGHLGLEKTLDRMKKNYWFAKMSRFVRKYVEACIECAYAKKNSTNEGFLHPIAKVESPFHTLHIDHLGPFVKSKSGYTHILVVVDGFTKFVFIRAVRNTNTQNVIKVLNDVFDTFRTPDRLVSDRGSCFTSHAFRRFCLDRGIKHILNAVACPRSNGQVERYNRTILEALKAQNMGENERDWDTKLGKIQWGLNNSIQKTIGRAPAEVMFGKSMNSEVNPILNEVTQVNSESHDIELIRGEVKTKIDEQQKYQKEYYDRGRKPARVYGKGDLVKIIKVNLQNDGKSSKLLPAFEGPFRVIKVLGNDRYKLAPIPGFEGMKNKRNTTVAVDRMRPWIHVRSLEIDDDNAETVNETSSADSEDDI